MTNALTNGRTHSQRDAVAALLDQVDDVSVVQGVDIDMVDGQYPVSNLQPSATFCRRTCAHHANEANHRTKLFDGQTFSCRERVIDTMMQG